MTTLKLLFAIAAGSVVFALAATSLTYGTRQSKPVASAPENTTAPGNVAAPFPSPAPGPAATPGAPAREARVRVAPREIKAIYLTSWSAATPSRLRGAMNLIQTTDLNGVVIDVKDYTGKVTFVTSSPLIKSIGSEQSRLGDLTLLVERLHQAGIYVIVRIAVFQDQHLIKVRPGLAVKDARGNVWRDRKGLGWVDPAAQEAWAYVVEIAREAVNAGVDELNFDYIRFPTDGNLSGLRYPFFDEAGESRRRVIQRFFAYLNMELRPTGRQLSADLFGLATVTNDDLGIGQVLEDAFPYFDFISPMVYPSHYARGFLRHKNPAAHPYEVVRYSLERAVLRRARFARSVAALAEAGVSGEDPRAPDGWARIRPWLQAFDLGAPYPAEIIRKQFQAVQDAGLTHGWYLWSPSNSYQPASFVRQ